MKVKIHREGTNILIILLLILLVVNASAWMFIRPAVIPIVFSSVSGVFYLLVVNFFRSPRRHFPGKVTDSLVVSSVDGRVVALEQVYESEVLHRDVIQLSVFMSVVNVHANWFPVNGEVKLVRHHGGRFLSAYLPKASLENERSTILIRATAGCDVLVRQIAGAGDTCENWRQDGRRYNRSGSSPHRAIIKHLTNFTAYQCRYSHA